MPLDYAMPQLQRRTWSRKIARFVAVFFGIVVVLLGSVWLFVWMIFHQMDRVTLTVDNQTTRVIDSVQITDGNGIPVLNIGPIAPGGQSATSIHFGNDEGGESDLIINCGGRKASQGVWMLINTHGPYDYKATVRDTGVHVEYHVASKGSGAYDFASPTTMP
jgi:hypothetical protein